MHKLQAKAVSVSRRALFRGRLLLTATLLYALAAPPLALAHSGGAEEVMTTMDALPPALGNVRVELHRTLGMQLVVQNITSADLEIFGRDGKAFLRIGPGGVEANVNAPDWYRFYSVSGVALPDRLSTLARGESLPADWQIVSRTPAWGWFDTRVDAEGIKVTSKLRRGGERVAIKAWRVPVSLNGSRHVLSGKFEFMPPSKGSYESRMTLPADALPEISLQLIQGPSPAFLLTNKSAETLTVMDAEGMPMLEVSARGVRGNVRSPGWQASGMAESNHTPVVLPAGHEPLWVQRSEASTVTWLDPRAAPLPAGGEALTKAASPRPIHQWTIPYTYQGKHHQIEGVTAWMPYQPL